MSATPSCAHYEVRFRSLSDQGRELAFPCDAAGQVNLDELTDCARHNYFYARAVIGREFASPMVAVSDEAACFA